MEKKNRVNLFGGLYVEYGTKKSEPTEQEKKKAIHDKAIKGLKVEYPKNRVPFERDNY